MGGRAISVAGVWVVAGGSWARGIGLLPMDREEAWWVSLGASMVVRGTIGHGQTRNLDSIVGERQETNITPGPYCACSSSSENKLLSFLCLSPSVGCSAWQGALPNRRLDTTAKRDRSRALGRRVLFCAVTGKPVDAER